MYETNHPLNHYLLQIIMRMSWLFINPLIYIEQFVVLMLGKIKVNTWQHFHQVHIFYIFFPIATATHGEGDICWCNIYFVLFWGFIMTSYREWEWNDLQDLPYRTILSSRVDKSTQWIHSLITLNSDFKLTSQSFILPWSCILWTSWKSFNTNSQNLKK